MKRVSLGGSGKKVLALLGFASWLLLAVSWVMSLYAYPRLPEKMALWTSILSREVVSGPKSPLFFVYPVLQTVMLLAAFSLARAVFLRAHGRKPGVSGPDDESGERLLDLKRETAYLGLIFLNLVFIHLQTSLILVSHGLAKGINRSYFGMLLVVLAGLVPYYRIRRQMLDTHP
jgi:uncharacterized membrane protein